MDEAAPNAGPDTETDVGSAVEAAVDASDPTDEEPVRYEVVFDCRDRTVGGRLVSRIHEVIGPTFAVSRGEEGPTWSVSIEFPSSRAADRFFSSDFYRQFCIEVRRSANSSVLVVPLGSA